MNQVRQADALAKHLLKSNGLQAQQALQLAQNMAQGRRLAVVEQALKKYTTLAPNDPQGWTNLAALQLVLNKRTEIFVSLKKAIQCGGEPARAMIRKDRRFNPIRNTREYQQLIPPPTSKSMGLVPLPGM
jgi:predicted Zn-dependent protease